MNADDEKYRKYLQSDKWRNIARQRMKIDNFTCCMCGSRGTPVNPIEVHHLSYKALYHEEDRIYEDLMSVCRCCHKLVHKGMERVTDPSGRRGWKDARIPQIHCYNINGNIEMRTGGIEE